MKLTVHIGLHKTGTTSLQAALAHNRELLRQEGVLYPIASSIPAGGHLNLVWEAVNSWKYRQDAKGIEDIIQEIKSEAPAHTIISAESFSGYQRRDEPMDAIERLCQETGAECEIVCTVRPQFILVESLYAQNASTGYTSAKFEPYVINALSQDVFDFESIIGRWFDRFGAVKMIPLEPSAGKQSLIDQFLNAIQVHRPDDFEDVEAANIRASIRVVEYGRKATEILNRTGETPAKRHEVVTNLRSAVSSAFVDDPKFAGLNSDMAAFVSKQFELANRKFELDRLEGQRLFRVPVEQYHFEPSSIDIETASSKERDQFEELFARSLLR